MEKPMSNSFKFTGSLTDKPKLCVVGVGGGGGNAVNDMITRGISGVEFIAVNTDAQALRKNLAPVKIQAGSALTKGLGAGARPTVGADAVEESREEIKQALRGFDMVFITAGMGGGTGTGGAPVVAAIAQKLHILTVAIVTQPFEFEGARRRKAADEGIELLRDFVDTLIVVPNERLMEISDDKTSWLEAFSMVDNVLYNAARGISDLITVHGLVNLDFADVKTTMEAGGQAVMGAAEASGAARAEVAAKDAISSPLLDGLSIAGASNVLVNITSGKNITLQEVKTAVGIIREEAGAEVEVIFGTVIDQAMDDKLSVTVVATGFDLSPGLNGQPPYPRRTMSLSSTGAVPNYKGEDNLKKLDVPAYVRREIVRQDEESERSDRETREEAQTTRAKINRLHRDNPGQTRKEDTDTPAFLRKMMD
ncbi:MAG: cell division protein FtsZ [Bacteroidetes bacterium SB0662_bin_6]|nr:cell division protein FtsZ [Bacteroidetes bacterium SB0668_bin_1]MYE05412.1 cell division protein FtsZ [Bacteroidetes bacterium SB0662_bin_6]